LSSNVACRLYKAIDVGEASSIFRELSRDDDFRVGIDRVLKMFVE
jgi:hypothetical protein